MRQALKDGLLLLSGTTVGLLFGFSGLYFIGTYSAAQSTHHQIFHLLGLVFGLLGALICVWLLASIVLAAASHALKWIGLNKAGTAIAGLSPAFVRRLVAAVVGCTLLAGPAQAVDLGFSDSAEAPPASSAPVENTPAKEPADSVAHEPSPDPSDAHVAEPSPAEPSAAPSRQSTPESDRLPQPAPSPVTTLTPTPSQTESAKKLTRAEPRPEESRSAAPRPVPSPDSAKSAPSPRRPSPPGAPHPEQPRRAQSETTHVVVQGQSLWSIAQEELGPDATEARIQARWQQWYHVNRKAIGPNPNLIMPGMVLQTPETS
ncbi:LysM peptidoglycan-binding domain-containing protein [Micrococcoides hystricis]|uniref:LysM peptidoglycan-binding domain-containing protein n=1 Tax=Micrococcoides hystricis TaxID=1572761 RepID=A0ABV6P925_9MICC